MDGAKFPDSTIVGRLRPEMATVPLTMRENLAFFCMIPGVHLVITICFQWKWLGRLYGQMLSGRSHITGYCTAPMPMRRVPGAVIPECVSVTIATTRPAGNSADDGSGRI